MNKIKLTLTHMFGDTYAAVIVDRVQCGTFMKFGIIRVQHSRRDDFVFVVEIDSAIVYCHEIEIEHPLEKKEWFFGLGTFTDEVNATVKEWLSLFRDVTE